MKYGLDFCNGGVATSNGGYQTPDKGFDNNTATYYQNQNSVPCWIKYDLGEGVAKIGKKYTITLSSFGATYCPSAWLFQGSNDNTTWTTLDSQSGITWSSSYQKKEFEFINTTSYRYYMWYFTGGPIICIAEFEVMGSTFQEPLCYITSRKRERYMMKPISSLNYTPFQNTPIIYTGRGQWNSPTMVSNTSPSPYVTSASTEYGSGYAAWKAFDKNGATRWSTTSNTGVGSWIKMYMGSSTDIIVTGCTMQAYHISQRMSSFKVQGSKDNINWTDIYSGGMDSNTNVQSFSFSNNISKYDYIRIYCVDGGSTVSMWEITFSGYYKQYNNYLRKLRDRLDMSGISTKDWYRY